MSTGITNLKSAILLAVAFANETHKAAQDGFKASDLFGYIDEVMQVQAVVEAKDAILAELADLDLSERAEIMAAVAAELNVGNDKAEAIVTDAIDWLAATYKLGKNIAA